MLKDIRSKFKERFGRSCNKDHDKRLEYVMASAGSSSVATREEILLALFAGVGDPDCQLSLLRGMPHILKLIYQLATNEVWWKRCIRLPDSENDAKIVRIYKNRDWSRWNRKEPKGNYLFLTEVQQDSYYARQLDLIFPPPTDIKVNMMPFILGRTFDECKLPGYLRPYWPFIERCSDVERAKTHSIWFHDSTSQIDKVCYITVHESMVQSGQSQRRPGLHIDCPGHVKIKKKDDAVLEEDRGEKGAGLARRYTAHHWGLGGCHFVPPQRHVDGDDVDDSYMRSFEIQGGIFMASSVENSCQAWNCKIVPEGEGEDDEDEQEEDDVNDDDDSDSEVEKEKPSLKKKGKDDKEANRAYEAIGRLGDIEHLRHLLPDNLRQTLKANRLYWMTDRTPHESLPVKEATYRQFFRLVMSEVSLWYEDHSTPNPKGVKPDPKITKIVKGNKFAKCGVEIVE